MLHLLRGRANTGKSRIVLERIARNGAERPQILLVPDHASFAAEDAQLPNSKEAPQQEAAREAGSPTEG